jgi:hypothetical protein
MRRELRPTITRHKSVKAPIGAVVKITYDGNLPHGEGHVLRATTGRLYLIIDMRRQARGKHAGRLHLRCLVIDELPSGATVHPLCWHPRTSS